MYGLALAKDAGFDVDQTVWDNGLSYLKAFSNLFNAYKDAGITAGENAKFQAYVNYVLSIADPTFAKTITFSTPQTDSTADLAGGVIDGRADASLVRRHALHDAAAE